MAVDHCGELVGMPSAFADSSRVWSDLEAGESEHCPGGLEPSRATGSGKKSACIVERGKATKPDCPRV